MSIESLGGSLPAGQPVAVATGNRAHVFAIGAGGTMNHWTSTSGGPWSSRDPLPGANLAKSFPCATVAGDGSLHVFAIANGGALTHWRSADGIAWVQPQIDGHAPIPGDGNGLAAVSLGGGRVDAFAVTQTGVVQFSFDGTTALPAKPVLPGSLGLNRCVLAAVSASPGVIDVFGVDLSGTPIRWRFDGTWTKTLLAGPKLDASNNAYNVNLNSFAAVANGAGRSELFSITADKRVTQWSLNGLSVTSRSLPNSPWPLAPGVLGVVARSEVLDVLAIGQGGPLQGGPLVRWRFDGAWGSPVAYGTGLAAGGAGAVLGPVGLEAFGIQSGADNRLLHWPAGISAARRDGWVNWSGFRRTDFPEGHCYPTSREELVAIVRTAAQQGKRVRAVGSSWSFTDIAMTPGYVVETNQLTRVLTSVLPKAQAAGATSIVPPPAGGPPTPFHLVHVEAGIQLEALMGILDSTNMAPGTMGGAAGQTLGGVISTSVHGCHHLLPPFPDWVRAIHLVGPDGKQYWIEPADQPITDGAKLVDALEPEVTIKYDNDWFDSVLVGVGSLGIIYSVVLEVRAAYKLEETRARTTWSGVRQSLAGRTKPLSPLFSSVKRSTPPDGVQVAIDPGSMASADPVCFLSTRRTVPMSTGSSAQSTSFDPLAAFCEGDGLLELLVQSAQTAGVAANVGTAIAAALPVVLPVGLAAGAALAPVLPTLMPLLAAPALIASAVPILIPFLKMQGPGAIGDMVGLVLDKVPQLTPVLTSALTSSAQSEGVGVDIAHQVMARRNKGECAARGLALEIAFDASTDAHLKYADAAIALLKSEAANGNYLGGWFSMRFVGRSRAILSPQRAARTCMFEFVGLRTLTTTRPLLDRLEALGRTFGGIQHWAMGDNLTAADVARSYPRVETWRATRWQLTNGGTVRTFDNAFTARSGLSEPPANPNWTGLGGVLTSGPAVAAPGRDWLQLYARGTDNALWTNARAGGGWTGWSQLAPNPIGSDPAAVSWGPGRIDVFAVGTDNQMYTIVWNGIKWSGWTGMGGVFTSGPAVASWGPNRLDVFARGTDNALYVKTFAGAGWTGWNQVSPAPIGSDPAAVSWGPNRIDVFVRGTDNQIATLSRA